MPSAKYAALLSSLKSSNGNTAIDLFVAVAAPLDRGADLAVFLGSAESDGLTGKLLSAVWDPWEELMTKLPELPQDVYTLRRIVPKDRGIAWGDK